MNIEQALTIIGQQIGVDPQLLIDYANEDQIGGYHSDETRRKWGIGSIWEVEGKIWYAIVRGMRPNFVVEVGVRYGCSTKHILAALDANERGKLVSFDVNGEMLGITHPRWEFHQGKMTEWNSHEPVDLMIEDGWHTYEDCLETLTRMLANKPCMLISHDAAHEGVGPAIQQAWHELFDSDYETFKVEPSDCGFSWRICRENCNNDF